VGDAIIQKRQILKKKQLPASRKDNCPQPPLGFCLDLVARGSHGITSHSAPFLWSHVCAIVHFQMKVLRIQKKSSDHA